MAFSQTNRPAYQLAVDASNLFVVDGYGEVTSITLATGAANQLKPPGAWCFPFIAIDDTSVFLALSTDQPESNRILKIPRGGGEPVTLFDGSNSFTGFAADRNYAYFAEYEGSIRKVPVAGGAAVTLAAGDADGWGSSLAINDTAAFWIRQSPGPSGDSESAVMSVPLAGGAPSLVASGPARELAVDATNVYWTTQDRVLQAPVTGGTPVQVGSTQTGAGLLALDATSVYWTHTSSIWEGHFYESTVMRAPIGGGVSAPLARRQDLAGPLAVAGKGVFWAVKSSQALNGSASPSILRLSTDACQAGMCN